MTMPEDAAAGARDERLRRLVSYVAADPGNAALRADAAERALDAGEPQVARALLAAAGAEPGERELNLLGLAGMELGHFDEAARSFQALIDRGVTACAVRFNLAWSLAMEKRFEAALSLLSPEVTAALPQAAMLEVKLLHEAGEFDRAAQAGRRHMAAFPDDQGLAAAVSVLALDIEDLDLARSAASKAAGHPDATTTLGTLALGESKAAEAAGLFERALAQSDRLPRAWIGLGLARMIGKDGRAASDIDRGAELFGDHIGSWIAAGWAHLVANDMATARQRFERVLRIDDNFAESHGSLAVADLLEGRPEEAARRIAVAKRLDRECFSAAFAQALLTARGGDPERARHMVDRILETPVNARGDTAAAAIARIALR
jgi:tetratricopeptide (TPR) repeat protein